jgi:hypothetical protein
VEVENKSAADKYARALVDRVLNIFIVGYL